MNNCWAQKAPDYATARRLLSRHLLEDHVIDQPEWWAIRRLDAKLAAAGTPYQRGE